MDNQLDIEKIGKQMPYIVPDGFFSQMQADVERRIRDDNRRMHRRRNFFIALALSAAASVTLLFVLSTNDVKSTENDMQAVEQAYNNLSEEDQAFLTEVYQDDIFLSEYATN